MGGMQCIFTPNVLIVELSLSLHRACSVLESAIKYILRINNGQRDEWNDEVTMFLKLILS